MIDTRIDTHIALACPVCRNALVVVGDVARCRSCQQTFGKCEGIWRFLSTSRQSELADFSREYQKVRADEGWGASDPNYYRALPHIGRNDPHRDIWHIRARSFQHLLALMGDVKPLKILDVGAGNGWLSNRLALLGHTLAALDLSDDPRDGLSVLRHYMTCFEAYQAEFDRMPFCDAQFDLVIFNAALHYSCALAVTLREAWRVMRLGGQIVVLDSPFYSKASSGLAMLAEREAGFTRKYGFNRQVHSVGFLTAQTLKQAAAQAGLTAWVYAVDDGWLARLRRRWIYLRTGREPARFPLVVFG